MKIFHSKDFVITAQGISSVESITIGGDKTKHLNTSG
ncbi:hypothetical protein BACSP_03942 [Bacillus sp. T2.9-1]|nr:hypothetical protein BACSP_03942 [Bacillus sp. T2.9-1]